MPKNIGIGSYPSNSGGDSPQEAFVKANTLFNLPIEQSNIAL